MLGPNTESLVFLKPLSIVMIRVKTVEKSLKETFHTMISLSCSFSETKISDCKNKGLPRYTDEILRDDLCF